MPRSNSVSGGDGEDYASSDEVKVYKDEGDEEKPSSENLAEDKLGLVIETEEGKVSDSVRRDAYHGAAELAAAAAKAGAKPSDYHLPDFSFGYPLINPYSYHKTSAVSSPNKNLSPSAHSGLVGFYNYGSTSILQPPPAHMGISPLAFDLKTGLPRHPIYGLPPPPGHLLYGSDISIHGSAHSSLPGPFPVGLNESPLPWYPPPGIFSAHPGISHPAFVTCGSTKDLSPLSDTIDDSCIRHRGFAGQSELPFVETKSKRNHIKKPLNAFMIFMKEMRQTVIDECTLKESAAINQILGRRWHALERSEQAKYYEMARKEKELHMQLYPGWSARDNYATRAKKKKLKRDSGSCCDDEPRSPDSKLFNEHYKDDQQQDWGASNWSRKEYSREGASLQLAKVDGSKVLFSGHSPISVSS